MWKYYLKVIELFEQASCHCAVLKVAEVAVANYDRDDPRLAVLWSIMFKYHLQLGYYEKAHRDMMSNPDLTRRKECLQHFIVVLTELNQLKLICNLHYPGMEDEVVRVIEDRARTTGDLMKQKYYDLLYCYHTTHSDFRRAASVMYEYGLRLGREAPGSQSLRRQSDCYVMCLTALRLEMPQYAWVVVPIELEEMMEKNTKKAQNRKRPRLAKGSQSQKVQVEVRTISDIEKDYSLVNTKLSLVQTADPSVASQIYSPFVSPEEVVSRLIQVGMFDRAIDTAQCFKLPLDSIFEVLASRCVHLTVNLVGFRDDSGEAINTWNWLGANESSDTPTLTEKTVVDKAWLMLKTYLEKHDHMTDHRLQKCVARKLLSLGSHLPHWLIQSFKETNPADLLRLYLSFDLLEEATRFALIYIDAILGPCKEEFGMKDSLHASSPSVWLPYTLLDHLRLALRETSSITLRELSAELSFKLGDYMRTTSSVTADKENEARHHY